MNEGLKHGAERSSVLDHAGVSSDGRVFLVSSASYFRRNVVFILQQEGYDVLAISEGRELMDLVRDERPALVLIDGSLADMTGFEACASIKKELDIARFPVVMFSLEPTDAFRAKALASGAFPLMRFPLDPRELTETITYALAGLPKEGHKVSLSANGEDKCYEFDVTEVLAGRRVSITLDERFRTAPITRGQKIHFHFMGENFVEVLWEGTVHKVVGRVAEIALDHIIDQTARRQAVRRSVPLQVTCRMADGTARIARVVNMSIAGMMIADIQGPLAIGTKCSFKIDLGGKVLDLEGEIKRAEDKGMLGFEAGVAFTLVPQDARDALLDYLFVHRTPALETEERPATPAEALWTQLATFAQAAKPTEEPADAVAGVMQVFRGTRGLIDGLADIISHTLPSLEAVEKRVVKDLLDQMLWESSFLKQRLEELKDRLPQA